MSQKHEIEALRNVTKLCNINCQHNKSVVTYTNFDFSSRLAHSIFPGKPGYAEQHEKKYNKSVTITLVIYTNKFTTTQSAIITILSGRGVRM